MYPEIQTGGKESDKLREIPGDTQSGQVSFVNCRQKGISHSMDNKQVLIEVSHLTHIYETEGEAPFYALRDVSLQINKGGFVAVIGTNGSGKSTLARHLDAILLPSEGDVLVDGLSVKNPDDVWKIRQKVGMVFQNPDNQLVASIVEDDVAFGPENLGGLPIPLDSLLVSANLPMPQEEIIARVADSLKKVGMESYRKHSPSMLSGGQKQRIAIAGVLAMHPECIVLDEPTAMLDPSGRKEVMETIHRLNKEMGITIVLITHFMEEAVTANRVVVIHKGQITADGTPEDVFSKVEDMKAGGLDVPVPTELSYRLAQLRLPIRGDCMTNKELGEELCRFVLKK